MKKYLLFASSVLFFFSCKKNTTTIPESGNVTIHFQNTVAGQPVEYGKYNYTNAAGNIYNVSMLKYYVSNVILTTDNNEDIKLGNYDLIDAFDTQNFSVISAGLLPNAVYKSIRFNLGIDSARNHNGAQDGDLDPAYNMIWNWNTGYLFMKHEGRFINTIGDTLDLQYHLGTDLAYSTVSVPINMTVSGSSKTLNLEFDLNSMYNSPVIDFNTGAIHHSTLASDKAWINDMIINAQDAFKFISAE
ncbi:MAG: hypothetical protein IT257_04885 [Chitinophagaceae bacterium]|nr:hypothetical protein [Chitinophagaceae bacterium]